ncbi:MAG: pentapeptide repeat-containing protein [Paracoccaceae bacterium]
MTESKHEPGRRDTSPSAAGSAFLLLVFTFGIAAGLMVAVVGAGVLEENASLIFTIFSAAIVVVAIVGGLVLLFRRPIMRRILGVTDTRIESFADPLSQVARAAMDRDPGLALGGARDLVVRGLALYGWLATRRWIVMSLTALIAAMAALAGTALLFRQNELIAAQSGLLEQQNQKIEAQTALLAQDVQLAEAARNAMLAVEITEIAALVGGAADAAMADMEAEAAGLDRFTNMINVLDPAADLGRGLVLRIVSASRAARPYRFLDPGFRAEDDVDKMQVAMQRRRDELGATYARMAKTFGWTDGSAGNRLIDRPASPERGQLLQVLTSGGIRNLEALNHLGLDLSFAYFPGADLYLMTAQGARLSYADFGAGAIRECDFGGAYLENTRFRRARIQNTTFAVVQEEKVRAPWRPEDAPYSSYLSGADFDGATLIDVDFTGAFLMASSFDGALLVRTNFNDASLGAATLRGAVLMAPKFDGAILKLADLDGAVVFGEDFLTNLEAAANEGTFAAPSLRMEPMTLADVMAISEVGNAFYEEEVVEITEGLPAFRLVRIGALED